MSTKDLAKMEYYEGDGKPEGKRHPPKTRSTIKKTPARKDRQKKADSNRANQYY